ncbi:MAG: hypothetical protein DMF84_24710 [Acidobacteria bacterium]|nr:MAG: hypothetical protein DMF84_24710 [Acidobacteriota bacterium]
MIAGVIVGIVLAVLAYTTFADRSTPEGQPPLAHVTRQTFDEFKSEFNRSRGQVRVIVLLSPT